MTSGPFSASAATRDPVHTPADPDRSTLTLLCVANYPANTGYAWDFIERIYARVADRLAERGMRTLAAYPAIPEPPRTLEGSAAQPVTLDASLGGIASVRRMAEFVRRERVSTLYLTDLPVYHWSYPLLRRAGIRRIVVHDHTSGARERPTGARRLVKRAVMRFPGVTADLVIAVSDYVARRQLEVGLLPSERVVRVWNGIPVPPLPSTSDGDVRRTLGIEPERPLVVAASRASRVKGIDHLLKAFERLIARWGASEPRPVLVYVGDGPDFPNLRDLQDRLTCREDVILTGYRPDAAAFLRAADLCVVPSVWQDALPLGVLEPMALGKAVVATEVGGIPEMIEHGVSGLLVPPGDPGALAGAMELVLRDAQFRGELGRRAREHVGLLFRPEEQIETITGLLLAGTNRGERDENTVPLSP